MPRRLAKSTKRKGVRVRNATVRFSGGSYLGHQFRLEYVDSGHSRLERTEPAKDLVAIIASHSYGSNLARLLAYVEGRRPAYVCTPVRQVYRTLSELWKTRKKVRASLNHLVWLTATASDPTRHQDIPAVTVCSSKRVARQRSLGAFIPSHNRPRI